MKKICYVFSYLFILTFFNCNKEDDIFIKEDSCYLFNGCTDFVNTKSVSCEYPLSDHKPCNSPIGGSDFNINPPESLEGYNEALLEIDFCSLPEEIDISFMTAVQKGFVAYALDIKSEELPNTLYRQILLDHSLLGVAVLGALDKYLKAEVEENEEEIPFDAWFNFFRRGFHRFYTCSREFPENLDQFRTFVADYTSASSENILPSVKGCNISRKTQNILNSKSNAFITSAETTQENGDIKETEFIVSGIRNDGNLDFIAYDHNGQLMDRSEFSAASGNVVVVASPFVCMSCHFESINPVWKFGLREPKLVNNCE